MYTDNRQTRDFTFFIECLSHLGNMGERWFAGEINWIDKASHRHQITMRFEFRSAGKFANTEIPDRTGLN